jgi:hypothetical protein
MIKYDYQVTNKSIHYPIKVFIGVIDKILIMIVTTTTNNIDNDKICLQ